MVIVRGDYVWMPLPLSNCAAGVNTIGARVVAISNGRLCMRDDDGHESWLDDDVHLTRMHPTSVQGVDDMINLNDLSDAAILRNLAVRYHDKLIYTYMRNILVAVNPYQLLPIYGIDQIYLYRNRRIGELPPHIFAVADSAYSRAIEHGRDFSIVISGESGAGKTESMKVILQYMAAVSGKHTWIEQQIIEANPILEAFGNATTVHNDNSSRFGRYIVLYFDENGFISCAKIKHYMLEKSRIVTQSYHERNYHIFYSLLAGLSADDKRQLDLHDASDYYCLTQGESAGRNGREEVLSYMEIKAAMKVLFFSDIEIWSVVKVLSGLLHLGNVKFSGIAVMDCVFKVSELVKALTCRSIRTKDESVVLAMTPEQSLDVRDALVREIYGKLFEWLVRKINSIIFSQSRATYSVVILDVYGFENLFQNSFEQLCINYANEVLQQFYIRHVFKLEQEEYKQYEISWNPVNFADNQNVLELIADGTNSILSILDDESRFPMSTTGTFLVKLHEIHCHNKNYFKPKSDLNRCFGIRHYAGFVYRVVSGFVEKNRDAMNDEMLSIIDGSKFLFLQNLFLYDVAARRAKVSVSGEFRKSLKALMKDLEKREPFFIRCIKPNNSKAALLFDRELCCKQLRYSGMLETVRIRRSGFSLVEFVDRYRILVSTSKMSRTADYENAARIICMSISFDVSLFQIGRSRIFLKVRVDIRCLCPRLKSCIVCCRTVRGWLQRLRYVRLRFACIVIQRSWRCYLFRKRYNMISRGFARLQAVIRSRRIATIYRQRRRTIIAFQVRSLDDDNFFQTEKNRFAVRLLKRKPVSSDDLMKEYLKLLEETPKSNLDKLHFIIGHGILRPQLRNEIFCQICKQLTENPSSHSLTRGWLLLSLCLCCFAPSKKLVKYLRSFIRYEGISDFSTYSDERLVRTLSNGARNQPPSLIEIQAASLKKPIELTITLMNGATKVLQVDSAATSRELCKAISEDIGLVDDFGFSIYISMLDKVCSLGCGSDHVMDAISQCEQYAVMNGLKDQDAKWLLFFRKETFSPWCIVSEDKTATELIYAQVVQGVRHGEYSCDKDEEVAKLIALQYCVDHGTTVDLKTLSDVLPQYLPIGTYDPALHSQELLDTWLQLVLHLVKDEPEITRLVTLAMFKWPLLFSRFYEAWKLAGSQLPKDQVTVAINWTGIYVIDEEERVLLELSFAETAEVLLNAFKLGVDTFTIRTVSGAEYTFHSHSAKDIRHVISYFLDGLISRSRYGICVRDVQHSAERKMLHIKQGDLIEFDEGTTGDKVLQQGGGFGENIRTADRGQFSSTDVYILPTMGKPSNEVMVRLISRPSRGNSINAMFHARCDLWRYSAEPLKMPLLRKTMVNKVVTNAALSAYLSLMKYMGDYPVRKTLKAVHVVAHIFLPELLRDEVFCQIMKQLTDNPRSSSVDKGWELMWLALGLFAPSQMLYTDLVLFLRTRHTPIAADCYNRFYDKLVLGLPAGNLLLMWSKYIIRCTFRMVPICSKLQVLCDRIASYVQIKSSRGFSLFFKTNNKVISAPPDEFFFDFLWKVTDLFNKPRSDLPLPSYGMYFMRKMWVDVVPGVDRKADVLFHYPQEWSKYIHGYHKISVEAATRMGALIYQAMYKGSKQLTSSVVCKELIPANMLKLLPINEWLRSVIYTNISPNVWFRFLRLILHLSLSLPEKLILAFNKNGISIIHAATKEILIVHPFKSVSNWNSGNTYFHLTFGNLIKGSRLLCETTVVKCDHAASTPRIACVCRYPLFVTQTGGWVYG
ncbi:unnamed protein product [Soboliphyme baturini]|uniref:Myosin motor domain-containing protein n=1 Tax=Soboliphyme baturini TaxID=241478 RepID=A0A183IC34_9BILA|nr:unnamed protein product [Soboliphyme baturini]